jgi:hypothetical protein
MEDQVITWWQTHTQHLVVSNQHLQLQDFKDDALKRFYQLRNKDVVLAKWQQCQQIQGQYIQQCIDVFNKMFIKLEVRDSKDTLHVTLIYGLFPHLREGTELSFVTFLECTFKLTTKIEATFPKTNRVSQKKLVSSSQPPSTSKGQPKSNRQKSGPPNTTHATRTQKKRKWCSYHKYGHPKDKCKVCQDKIANKA